MCGSPMMVCLCARSTNAALQRRDCFDVIGLRKEVDGGNLRESVTLCGKTFQIAGKSRRIAGDIDDIRGPECDQIRESLGRSCAGWIEQEQIGGSEFVINGVL